MLPGETVPFTRKVTFEISLSENKSCSTFSKIKKYIIYYTSKKSKFFQFIVYKMCYIINMLITTSVSTDQH